MNNDKQTIITGNTSLFEAITNITKAHAYDILVEQAKELNAKNETLKQEIEVLKHNYKTAMLLALEYGYKQCEKGENIEAAFINYNKLLTTKP